MNNQATKKGKNAKRAHGSFLVRLLSLVSEPEFVAFENVFREPNIFKILGRSHFERWHSNFWGWLLDPQGSHLLGNYCLLRLVTMLFEENAVKPRRWPKHLTDLIAAPEIREVRVAPNEFLSTETSVSGVGRFDVFATGTFATRAGQIHTFNLLIELKIDATPHKEQSIRYADWLLKAHPDDLNMLVYFLPDIGQSAVAQIGDGRWHCVDYQALSDRLLESVLQHPRLNEKVRPFVLQYVQNLRIPYRGVRMAITKEEKELALALYEKYDDVFDAIYDILVETGAIEHSTSEISSKGRASGRIAVRVDDNIFDDSSLGGLFTKVLKFVVDSGLVKKLPLPWGVSKSRTVLTNEQDARHPNGRTFFYPITYNGYTMESHYSRDRGLQILSDLFRQLDVSFESVQT